MTFLSRLEGGTLYPSYSSGDYELPQEWKLPQKIVFGTFFTNDGDSSYIAGYDPLLNNGRSYYGHLQNVTWVEDYPITNLTLYSRPGFRDKAADIKLQPISTRDPERGEVINGFSSSSIEYNLLDETLYWELGFEHWSATLIADYLPRAPRSEPTPETASEASAGFTTIINNITNTYNDTTNNTTTNISNSGGGNVSIGEIGVVNNITTIDNSFTIQTTNINLSIAITGDSKKSEKVEGTDGDDLIADGLGKDKLIGGDGADQFYFSGEEPFKKKTVDKIIDFDASEGDAIVIADEVVGDLAEDPTMAIAETKKDLKELSKDGYDLLYFEPKGDLYVDGNGDSKGFGKKSEGGMIADLPNDTTLAESDVLIGI
jgi:hypothetical protein